MKKKILFVMLAVTLALGACGSKDKAVTDGNSVTETIVETESSTDSKKETMEASKEQNVISEATKELTADVSKETSESKTKASETPQPSAEATTAATTETSTAAAKDDTKKPVQETIAKEASAVPVQTAKNTENSVAAPATSESKETPAAEAKEENASPASEDPVSTPEPVREPENTPAPTPEPVHTHTMKTETVDATCGTDGYVKVYCTSCDYVEKEEVIPHTMEHTWGEPVPDGVPATCKEYVWVISTCLTCGHRNICSSLAGEHTPMDGDSVEPTCINDGGTQKWCSVCGIYLGFDTVPKTGVHIDLDGDGFCDADLGCGECVVEHECVDTDDNWRCDICWRYF